MVGHPLRPELGLLDCFIPFKGWGNYKQSSLLKPWPKTTIELVEHRTGLKFPDGTKGFPLELFYWLWKDHEFFLNDFFDTSVSNKLAIAAKNVLKTAFFTQAHIFLLTNFDNVHTMAMTKYQNALEQVYGNLKGYLDLIEARTGLSLHSCFDLIDDLDTNTFDIKIARVWKKYETKKVKRKLSKKQLDAAKELNVPEEQLYEEKMVGTEVFRRYMYLRSFDKPNKIANFPKQPMGVFVAFVQIIEPVMMNDPNLISASAIEDVWNVNKSSLFRYAYEAGFYAQMGADMNNWDKNNVFIVMAERILPYDKKMFGELGTYSATNLELNYMVRRLARKSNTLLPLSGEELKDYLALEKNNQDLWLAMYWGAPYKDIEDVSFTYLADIKNPTYASLPTPEELIEKLKKFPKWLDDFEPYYWGIGVDYGTSHATTVKVSLFIPQEMRIYRKHIWRYCNQEAKKAKQPTLLITDMISLATDEIINFILPYAKKGLFEAPFGILGDGGSKALVQVHDDEVVRRGLQDYLYVDPSQIFGVNGRKEKADFDNWVNGAGIAVYDENNQMTVEQYQTTRSEKANPEKRDEKNQLLDEIDATNIAEEEIRLLVVEAQYARLKYFGNLNFNKAPNHFAII